MAEVYNIKDIKNGLTKDGVLCGKGLGEMVFMGVDGFIFLILRGWCGEIVC
jgi:hypothetical protein